MPVLSEEVDWPANLSTQRITDTMRREEKVEVAITVGGETALISCASLPDDRYARVRQKLIQLGVPLEQI